MSDQSSSSFFLCVLSQFVSKGQTLGSHSAISTFSLLLMLVAFSVPTQYSTFDRFLVSIFGAIHEFVTIRRIGAKFSSLLTNENVIIFSSYEE
jgi:hypothetical protein